MKVLTFETTQKKEMALLDSVTQIISKAIAEYGDARILLSGGGTPQNFYRLLSKVKLPWNKVYVGLVDERYVPLMSPFSNESMIRDCLIQNEAADAQLIGMVYDTTNRQTNSQIVNHEYAQFKERVDLVILGMGEDGHTASLFPNDPYSANAMMSKEVGVFNTVAPQHPTERITCGLEMLMNAENKILLMSGKRKLQLLEQAVDEYFPITPFTAKEVDLQVYYSE
jgi:6-phosphogluconolactonase